MIYHDVLNQSVGNASLGLYEYLRDHTGYDTDLIWQNLLRTVQLSDLTKNLQLVRVLSQDNAQPIPQKFRVALVLHLYYMDILDQFCDTPDLCLRVVM